jgi:hypothetical protein
MVAMSAEIEQQEAGDELEPEDDRDPTGEKGEKGKKTKTRDEEGQVNEVRADQRREGAKRGGAG